MAAVGRLKASWLYIWILLWMVSLTSPTVFKWRLISQGGPDDWSPVASRVELALAVATASLGVALGWQRRWRTVWAAVGLGALVMAAGVEVEYGRGLYNDPPEEPGPFLYFAAIIGVLLWSGAVAGALCSGARFRRSNRGKWRLQ